MRLATVRSGHTTRAVRMDSDQAIDLGFTDLGELLRADDWSGIARRATGVSATTVGLQYAAPVARPSKVICVGLNYRNHILEMGREIPEFPTLFAKFSEAIIADGDQIDLDPVSHGWDWEAELAIVIGSRARRCNAEEAAASIAGFSIINDITSREYQYRTTQWLQGKTFEHTSPFGPVLVTPDELEGGVRPRMQIRCIVDGEVVQEANTGDLVFDPVSLVQYISAFLTLHPGDVIASGTPGGVGHARKPPRELHDGAEVVTEIDGIGRLTNIARKL